MTRISILIPVYNVADYIKRCLESVASQTFSGEMECLIIDDCGNDRSIEIAKQFIDSEASETPNITYKIVHHKQNRGLAAARNTGISEASGEFIMHLDSDDWLEPNAIELLLAKQRETDADIISGNSLAHFKDHDKVLIEPDYKDNYEMVRGTIQMTIDHVIWRRLIRKSLYTDNAIQAAEGVNIGEDHHTLPRLAYFAKKIAKVDTVIHHYNCMNSNSYMNSTSKGINLNRYNSDCRSIAILRNFFSEKDDKIADKLNRIETAYNKYMRRRAALFHDRQSYVYICYQSASQPTYYQDLLKYRVEETLNSLKTYLYQIYTRINANSKDR